MKSLSPKGKWLVELIVLVSSVSLAFFFWDSFILYPVKLFVVLLHESSHCLAALSTYGSVKEIQVSYDIGGACIITGGSQFIIAASGYVGSLILGGLLFISAKHYNFSRIVSFAFSLFFILLTIFYIKSLFGVFFCLGFTLLLIASPLILPEVIHTYLLKILGMISCIYVLVDIREDLFTQDYTRSDAQKLAELTGLQPVYWGIIIMVISVLIYYVLLRLNFRKTKEKGQNKKKKVTKYEEEEV